MTATMWRVLRVLGLGSLLVLGALLIVGVGRTIPDRPVLALLVALAVCAFGLTLMDSAIVPLAMVLPALVITRVNAGGVDLSFSDAALFIAFFPALFFAERPYTPVLRTLIWFGVIYEVTTLFTVVANPYRANVVEWVHAGLLTIGALVVGWSIGREGHARLGMTILMLGCGVIAASTIVQGLFQYAQGNFDSVYPTWPWDMHKNFVGCVLGIAAATAYVRPPWTRWPVLFGQVMFWLCVAGIIFAQSRQALVGLAVALIITVLRTHASGQQRRSKIVLLAVAPALAVVVSMVQAQIATGNEFNSYFQRIDWYEQAITVWRVDPLFGVGLRWWYTARFPEAFQPPNAGLEVLSSAGIFGLAGFVLMMGGSIVVLWRMDLRYGLLASVVLISRLVQGQLDLFWVAVQTSLPFLIVGICLGVHGREQAEAPREGSQTAHEVAGRVL